MKNNITRNNFYAFTVYPDKYDFDIFEKLRSSEIPCYVSPLHDIEHLDESNILRTHYHIVLYFNEPVTDVHADLIVKLLFRNIPVFPISSFYSFYVYFSRPSCSTNPDKCICLNDFNLSQLLHKYGSR